MRQVPNQFTSLFGKHILLGVTGSIAATKSILLVAQLLQQGALVKVILTSNARQFIQPNDFVAPSDEKIFTHIFSEDISIIDHISLAKWADILLIAPATAAIISRCATGLADQLLSLVYTATAAKTFIVPAMNQQMWLHHTVQNNVKTLQAADCKFLGPAFGQQACGDVGFGRMLEPAEIVQQLEEHYQQRAKNLNILITAGPTQEAIDPVRYLSNRSSGKMGYALAAAFAQQGANVTLISGPTNRPPPPVKQLIHTVSAREMQAAVLQQLPGQQVAISAAAVTDYRIVKINKQKIKKLTTHLDLALIKNADILQSMRKNKPHIYLVGFALETEQLVENAKRKLVEKNLDMIVANQLSDNNKIFAADHNAVHVLEKNNTVTVFHKQHKKLLAQKLVRLICARLAAK